LSRGWPANGINAAGQIVGRYTDASGIIHGFLLSGGTYTTLDDPDATTGTFPAGINNFGQIVGYYSNGFGTHAFLYNPNGGTYATLFNPLAALGILNAFDMDQCASHNTMNLCFFEKTQEEGVPMSVTFVRSALMVPGKFPPSA